jgi:dTDP-L-rhamnose 4-epimerase
VSRHVLVTGGAGFIGSRVALRLASEGWHVRVLDALLPQVHGVAPHEQPLIRELARATEFVEGDVRDPATSARALAARMSCISRRRPELVSRSTTPPATPKPMCWRRHD